MKTVTELNEARYVNSDVLQVLGDKPGTLQMWLARGLVAPTVENEGRGLRRKYSAASILRLYVLSKITHLGFSVSDSADICSRLFGLNGEYLIRLCQYDESWLIATRNPAGKLVDEFVTCNPALEGKHGPEALISRLIAGKLALVVHLGALITEATAKLAELESEG